MDPFVLTAVLLLALGVLFVLVELTLGTDGTLLILAVVCWIAASWFGWQGWASRIGWDWWAYALAVVLGIPAATVSVLAWLPNSPAGRKLFSTPDPDEVRPFSEEADLWRESMIGELVKSLTWMNPGGLVLIDGERHHAESEGLPIEPGQMVEIIDVRSNRFIVRLYEGIGPSEEHPAEPDDLPES